DNKLLAEPLRQPLAHQTGRDVGRSGRGDWHDQTHRPRWIGLRPSKARDSRERGSGRGHMQKLPAGKFHSEPPSSFTSLDHLVGGYEERIGHREVECLGGFEVDDKSVHRWLLKWQIARFLAA